MSRFWSLLLIPIAALTLTAGASKSTAVTISFHCEANASDGDVFSTQMNVGNPPRKLNLEKLPTITEREIKAIYPFPAQDGSGSMGAYFMVDNHGKNLIHAATTQHRNSYMVPVINGRPISLLYISKPVTDGILTIPSGITPAEISLIAQKFPIVGETSTEAKSRQAAAKQKQKQQQKEKTAE